MQAIHSLQGKDLGGANMEISLAKPPSDKKKKEEVLRNREKRLMQMLAQRGFVSFVYLFCFSHYLCKYSVLNIILVFKEIFYLKL